MAGSSTGFAASSTAAMARPTNRPRTSTAACAATAPSGPARVPDCATSPVVPVFRKFITVNSTANSRAPISTAPWTAASFSRATTHMSPSPISAVATLVTIAGIAMAQMMRGSMRVGDAALVEEGTDTTFR